MCRVKAIASSVERLLRYANCSGSSEAGSTEQMCSLTSFSKHLLKMGVRVGVDRLSAPILSILPIIDIGHFKNRFADNVFFFFFNATKHTIYR